MSSSKGLARKTERGISLLEVVVAMSLFSVLGLSVSQSAIMSLRFQKNAEIGNLARNLAISKGEELSGVPINLLDSSYSGTESNMAVGSHALRFTRTTTVTVNSDGSRTIDITVSCSDSRIMSPLNYSTRFAPWES